MYKICSVKSSNYATECVTNNNYIAANSYAAITVSKVYYKTNIVFSR